MKRLTHQLASAGFTLLALLFASQCLSQQLVVPDATAPGKIGRFKIEGLAEGSKVLWRIDAAGDVAKAPGAGAAHGSGLPGVHLVEAFVSPPGDAEPVLLAQPWTVGDKPTPPPEPVKTLADLVTAEQAPLLAAFYADLAGGVGLVKTPAQFQSAHAAALAAASVQSGVELVGHGALVEVNKRINAAIGTAAAELTAAQRTALVACLKKISAEFGKPTPPPQPPVVTATKLWIVAITTPETQTPQQTKALDYGAYWTTQRTKGHEYEHYLTGSAEAARYAAFHKYPAEVIVQDFTLGKVLGVEELPQAVDAAWFDSVIAKYSGAK